MTDAEADLVAARVLAGVEPRLSAIEAALRLVNRGTGANTRAVSELHRQMAIDAAVSATRHEEAVRVDQEKRDALREVRDALRALDDASPDPPKPDPVGEEIVDLKVRVIRGIANFPSAAIAYLKADPVRTTALLVASAGFLVDVLTGSPVSTALGKAILSLVTPSTGSAAP